MANEKNLRTPSTEEAREMQRRSAKKRSQNIKERKLIKERILEKMGESDWDEMIAGIIERAKINDKAFETLRDTIGEKPTEKVDVSANQEARDAIDRMVAMLDE